MIPRPSAWSRCRSTEEPAGVSGRLVRLSPGTSETFILGRWDRHRQHQDLPQGGVGEGLGSITEQILKTRADVTMGGGAVTCDESATAGRFVGETRRQQAEDRGYHIVTTDTELKAVEEANRRPTCSGCSLRATCPCSGQDLQPRPTGAPRLRRAARPIRRCRLRSLFTGPKR
jgi:hypothetical protein